MEISLLGRTALITGASLGLGYATAKAFYLAGAKVAILARRGKPLEESLENIGALPSEGAEITSYVLRCLRSRPDQPDP